MDRLLLQVLPLVDAAIPAEELLRRSGQKPGVHFSQLCCLLPCFHPDIVAGTHCLCRQLPLTGVPEDGSPAVVEVWERKRNYSGPERMFVKLMRRRGQGRDSWWKPDGVEGKEQPTPTQRMAKVTVVFAVPDE